MNEDQQIRRDEWVKKNVPSDFLPEQVVNIFTYRPRKGDIWSVKIPGKQRRKKCIDRVSAEWHRREENGANVRLPYVHWQREPKGRYSGIRVKWLLKYGQLIARFEGAKRK